MAMKHLVLIAALLVVPATMANLVDMTLDSSNAANIEEATTFVVDDMINVEVAEKSSFSGWVYWDASKFSFGPVDLTTAGLEVQLDARYHQEDYTWDIDGDPSTPDQTRVAYSDANMWLLLEDSDGTLFDLGWGDEPWAQDGWKTITKVLTGDYSSVPDFDGTQVTKLWVRSTNWDAPQPNNDYHHFSQLTITPEPSALALLVLGGLAALRRR
jgi:hypothetical protein